MSWPRKPLNQYDEMFDSDDQVAQLFELICFFDGGCQPRNPGGAMAFGFYCVEGGWSGAEIGAGSGFVPAMSKNTNNIAEYSAVVIALEWLYKSGFHKRPILFIGDSQMVVNQMNGNWRINGGKAYYAQASRCVTAFTKVFNQNCKFAWVPRDRNARADQLCNDEFDKHGIEMVDFSQLKKKFQ